MTKDMQRTHDNANYVRTSCIHDIQHTPGLKTCLYMCDVNVRTAGVYDTISKEAKRSCYWTSLLLSANCKKSILMTKSQWSADPEYEYLMRLTYVADSWCWYDLKQPTALEPTFDVSEKKIMAKVLDLSWTSIPKFLTVCLCPALK